MASSSTDLVTFNILSNGSNIDANIEVTEIRVNKEVNRIAAARITVLDGDASAEGFSVSSSDWFKPGVSIEIQAGYNNTNKTIFKGIVVAQGIRYRDATSSYLVVECKDESVKMTIVRKNAWYENLGDSDIMGKLVSNYGLSKSIASTTGTFPTMIQYYSTDWDFLVSRAEVNGMVVLTDQNKVTVAAPDSAASSGLSITYGSNVYQLDADLDARWQYTAAQAQSWDYSSQSVITGTGSKPSPPSQGNLDSATLASVLGVGTFGLQTTAAEQSGTLTTWASAQLVKSWYSRIRGTVKTDGNSGYNLGTTVSVAGMGNRFNGTAYLSGVQHEIHEGIWFTTLRMGLAPDWFIGTHHEVLPPPASALLPGARGMMNGTVMAIANDPDNETRIQVNIPVIPAGSGNGVWARLATLYATSGSGSFWIPEVGDEVLVSFLNDDPRYPVVVGSMYSKAKAPPYTPDTTNQYKAFVTKSKMKIEFDDTNKIMTLLTPAGNKLIISEQGGNSITLQDANSNKIVMNSSGISLDGPSGVKITSNGEVSISGTGGVKISSSASVNMSGMNVSISADTQLSASGNATAAFTSSGQTTVKGALVMIN